MRELGAGPASAACRGGGARSDLWLRIVASVLELPLQRIAVDEGAAVRRGAARGRGGRRVRRRPRGGRGVRQAARDVDPDPAWVQAYEDVHARYAAHYAPLRALLPPA